MATKCKDKELIQLVATLLSAGIGEGISSANSDSFCMLDNCQALTEDKNDRLRFSCPALSLVHDSHLNFNHGNANEAEKSAFELLSRSVSFEAGPEASAVKEFVDLSNVLLNNVSESFALLVDSRLRAHAEFLSRHGRLSAKRNFSGTSSFDLLDQKLQTLLELGNRVNASRVETKVEVVGAGATNQVKEGDGCEAAITFQVAMKLFVDSPECGLHCSLSARFGSMGSLYVSRDARHCKLALKIDTKDLLGRMKHQASQVVAQVVTLTNSYFVSPERTCHRNDSFLVIPPQAEPERIKEIDSSKSNSSSRSMALVSPDVSAAIQVRDVPLLMLNGGDDFNGDDSDTSELSPDQCEGIVDDVFGGIDLAVFSSGSDTYSDSPTKKPRLCE